MRSPDDDKALAKTVSDSEAIKELFEKKACNLPKTA